MRPQGGQDLSEPHLVKAPSGRIRMGFHATSALVRPQSFNSIAPPPPPCITSRSAISTSSVDPQYHSEQSVYFLRHLLMDCIRRFFSPGVQSSACSSIGRFRQIFWLISMNS